MEPRENYRLRLWQRAPLSYVIAASGVVAMTAIIHSAGLDRSVANVSMLYLLVVTGAALFLGSLPAVLASLLSFFSFDWFFVQPKHHLTVADPAEWLALCMFLLTATVTGQLTALLQARAEDAFRRKRETDALSAAILAVSSEPDRDRALANVLKQLTLVMEVRSAAVFIIDDDGMVSIAASLPGGSSCELPAFSAGEMRALAHADGSVPSGPDESSFEQYRQADGSLCFPISAESRVVGLLYLKPATARTLRSGDGHLIELLVSQASVVIQRHNLMRIESHAQALAEADRLKTALLSMVSHDFRSPLTAIKASVSSLMQEGGPWDPEIQRALLQGIDQDVDRLNRMVGNILDLSRLEAGAWRPRREMTPVAELVGAALDSFSASHNSRVQVELDHTACEVFVDPVQMVQVLRNLLENALKYSPSESPVELKGYREGQSYVIEVCDCGAGLPLGQEARIFEPFYRAPGLNESATPGVGVGLAVCLGLVEAHGGRLEASDRTGGGAMFRVILPDGFPDA